MFEKYIFIALIDIFFITILILYYFLVHKNILKDFNKNKSLFLDSLNYASDEEIIKIANSPIINTKRLMYMLSKYLINKDANYLVFVLEYSRLHRNYMFIGFFIIMLLLLNIMFFIIKV